MSAAGTGSSRPHLALRPIEVGDAERVHEWASQERACRFQAWGPNTAEETLAYVTDAAATWRGGSDARRVWVATSGDSGVVGSAEIHRRSRSCSEIAYAVHVDHWGRGVGTAIADALVALAFADPSVERVQATCDPRNLGSAAVLRKAGLVHEGTLRHTMLIRDGWRDSAMHAILRHEWSDRPRSHR